MVEKMQSFNFTKISLSLQKCNRQLQENSIILSRYPSYKAPMDPNMPVYQNKLTNKLYWFTVLSIALLGLISVAIRLSLDYSNLQTELRRFSKTASENSSVLAHYLKEKQYDELDNYLGAIIQQSGISYLRVTDLRGKNFEKGLQAFNTEYEYTFPLHTEDGSLVIGELVVQLDSTNYMQLLVKQGLSYLFWGALYLLLIFILFHYLLRNLLERHIEKVIHHLQNLDKTSEPLCLDRKRENDELDLLCDEINRFTKEIHRTYNLLEQQKASLEVQVLERTKELSDKNASLENAVTKIKRMQSTLVAHEKLASLGTLVASIAHEIRNPLNFVMNFSELLEESDEIEDIREISRVIQKHSQRIDQIVRSMQILIGENNEALEIASIPFIIQKSYHQALSMRMISDRFTPPKVTFKIHEHAKVPVFQESLARALTNIIDNSMYALDKKQRSEPSFRPEIIISTKKNEDSILIAVTDNGTGIPSLLGDKVFDPFLTTKSTGEGSGLGLTVAYNVVQKHGGTIEYSSEFGKWTEFTLELPIIDSWEMQ